MQQQETNLVVGHLSAARLPLLSEEKVVEKTYPISEIFGPTVQGEGPKAGEYCFFVRFAGCDWDCSWCLVGTTPVYDGTGRKLNIRDVRKGQSVLSVDLATGELVPDKVVRVTSHSVDSLYRVIADGKKIFITGEHTVYVPKRGGWVSVDNLRVGDEIYDVSKELPACHMRLANPMFDPATVKRVARKVSKTLRGRPKSEEHNKSVSLAKKESNPMRDVPGVAAKAFASQKERPTKAEKFVSGIAKDLGIDLTYTGYRKGKLLRIAGKTPDFVVTGEKKVVEVYDPTYPRRGGIKRYIRERPKLYESQGYSCLMLPVRLSGKISNKTPLERVSKQLSTFVRNGRKITSIKKIDASETKSWAQLSGGKKTVEVYNIETEKNHNYIANGLLVHNCDTKYAVNGSYPGWHRDSMTLEHILAKLRALGAVPGDWITLSGGNPALFVDWKFSDGLHGAGFRLAMETQGSRTFDCSGDIDCLIVSPKPPSSGMADKFKPMTVVLLTADRHLTQYSTTAIKMVAFNKVDMEWAVFARDSILKLAADLRIDLAHVEWHLSAGTPLRAVQPQYTELTTLDAARLTVCYSLADLWLEALKEPSKYKVFTMRPQMHALVWGQKAGV